MYPIIFIRIFRFVSNLTNTIMLIKFQNVLYDRYEGIHNVKGFYNLIKFKYFRE